jgi:hypothetical protein
LSLVELRAVRLVDKTLKENWPKRDEDVRKRVIAVKTEEDWLACEGRLLREAGSGPRKVVSIDFESCTSSPDTMLLGALGTASGTCIMFDAQDPRFPIQIRQLLNSEELIAIGSLDPKDLTTLAKQGINLKCVLNTQMELLELKRAGALLSSHPCPEGCIKSGLKHLAHLIYGTSYDFGYQLYKRRPSVSAAKKPHWSLGDRQYYGYVTNDAFVPFAWILHQVLLKLRKGETSPLDLEEFTVPGDLVARWCLRASSLAKRLCYEPREDESSEDEEALKDCLGATTDRAVADISEEGEEEFIELHPTQADVSMLEGVAASDEILSVWVEEDAASGLGHGQGAQEQQSVPPMPNSWRSSFNFHPYCQRCGKERRQDSQGRRSIKCPCPQLTSACEYCKREGHVVSECQEMHRLCARCLRRGHCPRTMCAQASTANFEENWWTWKVKGRFTRDTAVHYQVDPGEVLLEAQALYGARLGNLIDRLPRYLALVMPQEAGLPGAVPSALGQEEV